MELVREVKDALQPCLFHQNCEGREAASEEHKAILEEDVLDNGEVE